MNNMKKEARELFEKLTNKKVRSISEFDSGYVNKNFLINDSYVLRIPLDFHDTTLSYKHEKIVFDKIADLKLSEIVIFFDEESGVKLSKFVHATRFYIEKMDESQLLYVAKKLKKLHSSAIEVSFGYQILTKLELYKSAVDPKYHINPDYENKVVKSMIAIYGKEPLVLCHNDLVKGNLLFKFNNVVLIDWQNASLNNPYFDLASLISENNLDEESKIFFLKKYFGYKFNDLKLKRVEIFIDFQDIFFYYWSLFYFAKRNDPKFLDIAKEKELRISLNSSK